MEVTVFLVAGPAGEIPSRSVGAVRRRAAAIEFPSAWRQHTRVGGSRHEICEGVAS